MGKLKLEMIQFVFGLHVFIYMYLFHKKWLSIVELTIETNYKIQLLVAF
jgi:hypothetical protein